MPVILTDVDECIFDWATPFDAWVREQYPNLAPESHIKDHWHVEEWLGCDLEFSRDLIRRFNGDPQIWPYFKAIPEAKEVIKELHSEGWKFVAITACATDHDTYTGRWHNLREEFGEAFDALHCTGLHQSKVGYLSRYRPTYWVEDKMNHAIDGRDQGHASFLVNYKHNAKFGEVDGVTRVDTWHDIYDHIKSNERLANHDWQLAGIFPGNSI